MIVHAILINILNPKLSIFFFAFLPQFVSAAAAALPEMLALSAVFMVMTFVVFALRLFAAACATLISRPHVLTWMRRTFAARSWHSA